jgi:hypothetical protein
MGSDEELIRKLRAEREGLLLEHAQFLDALKFQIGDLRLAKTALADIEQRLLVVETSLGIRSNEE